MRKKEYPPLFQLGFHPISLADLRLKCVDAFPKSKSRPVIMDGLEKVVGILQTEKIKGEIWVNGSFTTEKKEPKDVDIVLYYDGVAADAGTPRQTAVIDWIDTDLKPQFYCDSYTQFHYPAGHLWHPETDWGRSYWLAKFGFSRAENPKGLAVIKL